MYPVMIYKHSDGYPEGVLPFLKEFAENFVRDRGDDAEYCVAQILRHWAIEDNEEIEARIKQQKEEAEKKGDKDPYISTNYVRQFTGWGVCLTAEPHGDIEHVYTVNLKTGKVRQSRPRGGMFGSGRPDVLL
jgi:hypothetical protein